MRMKESNRSPGKGSTVTLSRYDEAKRNPKPTTERGKRRAACRRRRAAAAALSMDNAEMISELTGPSA